MAFIELKLSSELLNTCINTHVYFPCDLPAEVGFEPKGTLTLLHGYKGSGADWFTMTAAARYAADNSLVLISPSCGNFFYQDSALGAYKTFVSEEMPMLLSRMFKFPQERERNFIAGLSMGGYGALYLGLSRPDIYGGCASFSGAVDMQSLIAKMDDSLKGSYKILFGTNDGNMPDSSSLFALSSSVAAMEKSKQPKILTTCGNEDIEKYYIKPQNDSFHAHAKTLGLANYKHMTWTGLHTWSYWDRSLVYAIDYFFNSGYAKQKHDEWAHEPDIYV